MGTIKRVLATEIKKRIEAGTSVLVCAYGDDEKFNAYHLDGAIPYSEFKARVMDLARDTEIIFYCA